jgi:hypothetical protein
MTLTVIDTDTSYGSGVISGTIKNAVGSSVPSITYAIRSSDGIPVRVSSVSGVFSFTNLDPFLKYTLIAHDPAHVLKPDIVGSVYPI